MASRNHFPPVEPVTTLSPSWSSTSDWNDAEIVELGTYFVALLITTILGVVMMALQFRALSRKIQQRRRRNNQPKQQRQRQLQRFHPFQTTRQAPTKEQSPSQQQQELFLSMTHGGQETEWDLLQQSHRRDKQQLANDIQAITQLQSEVTQQLSQLKGVLQHLQQQQQLQKQQQQQQQQQQPQQQQQQSAETNRKKND